MERSSQDRSDRVLVELVQTEEESPASRTLVSTPALAALRAAGTRHVYADTADADELETLVAVDPDGQRAEIDGNTANQPLVRRMVGRVLDDERLAAGLRTLAAGTGEADRLPLLYAVVCGRIGNEMARRFAAGRAWEVSLQLHMDLGSRPDAARRAGRLLRRMVPSAIVKVPFRPDAPDCFLVARDLEREGIPVNFTSTFSARQVVAAALLGDVARTNVFLGRISQGLGTKFLGEHVVLEAQRALRRIRTEDDLRTQLIAASMREWQTFLRCAGCDVFTAPCDVIRDFLDDVEVAEHGVTPQLDTSYADRLELPPEVAQRIGADGVARLHRVEPEFVELLRSLRRDPALRDGDALFARFDRAGFGDFFHAPDAAECRELSQGKTPDLEGKLLESVALDTHYSLLANADFERNQSAIDASLAACASA